jgi:hypothetical protein
VPQAAPRDRAEAIAGQSNRVVACRPDNGRRRDIGAWVEKCGEMAKLLGRFRHINQGHVIENGREVEFRIEMKSGDIVTVQMLVSEITQVTDFLDNLRIKASDD